MEDFAPLLAAFGGFFAGTFLFARVGRWLHALVVGGRKQFPFAVFTHSGPWLLALVVGFGYQILTNPHTVAWEFFFAAIAIAQVAWGAFGLVLERRKRIAQREASLTRDES